jgi:hypothetical protein
MQKLIEALTIFAKYQDREAPTCCEHDVLYIAGITRDEVSLEDRAKLDSLGFLWSDSEGCWLSFEFGSA